MGFELMEIMVALGTWPEAIKLAPVVNALEAKADCRLTHCATDQHREMLQ